MRKQAEKLGITNLTCTILYAQPSSVRQTATRRVPNIDKALQNYISLIDPTFVKGRTGGVKAHTYSIVAPNAKIYVEDTDHYVGWATKPNNHVLKIIIYTDTEEKRRKIAQIIDSVHPNGMLANIDWNKIKKIYKKINKEECIAAWKKLLDPETQKPASGESLQKYIICEKCGHKNPQNNKFCIECGEPL